MRRNLDNESGQNGTKNKRKVVKIAQTAFSGWAQPVK